MFAVEPRLRGGLKCGRPDAGLLQDFTARALHVPADCQIIAENPHKWVVAAGRTEYVVRDRRRELAVSRRKFPRISHLVHRAERLAHIAPTRVRQTIRCELAMVRKRVFERPSRVMVNIGAGRWQARNWRVLDHQGTWYRYAPFFVDYDHDLTSPHPLPFADHSVDLFYSEHVFEHLTDTCCAAVFRELRRCLRDSGGLRIVVPDAELIHRRFAERNARFFAPWMQIHNATLTEAFLILVAHPREPFDEDEVARRHATMPRGAFLDHCRRNLAYDRDRAGEHINWFDEDKLARMLRDAGFRRVERSAGQRSCFLEMRGPAFDRRAWYSLHVDAWP